MSYVRTGRTLVAASFALTLALWLGAAPALAGGTEPSGERLVGQSLIEPAYDDLTGEIIYLLTPQNSPFPTHTSEHAVAPLYLVLYPPGSTVLNSHNLNCAHNCPDHDNLVAAVGTGSIPGGPPGIPSVYGTNPLAVPGHDHLVAHGAHGDFNVAWDVVVILFTSKSAANTHITTLSALTGALSSCLLYTSPSPRD